MQFTCFISVVSLGGCSDNMAAEDIGRLLSPYRVLCKLMCVQFFCGLLKPNDSACTNF